MLRVFLAIVAALCFLQVFSLLRSATPTIDDGPSMSRPTALLGDVMTMANRSLLVEQQPQQQQTQVQNGTAEQEPSDLGDLESVLADPIVARAVADYYERLKSNDTDISSNTDRHIRVGKNKLQEQEAENDEEDGEKLAYYQTHPIFKQGQERINAIPTTELCHSFGVKPLSQAQLGRLPHHPDDDKQQQRGRRVFFGSLIANESWEMIEAHAIEVQDLYHVVAFVESNTTQSNSPRQLQYGPGSDKRKRIQDSGLFGNSTKVLMGQWLYDWPDLLELNREVEQRNKVVGMWIEAGMTRDDVGILADIDEIVSRDFLRALQLCDFPKLRRQHEDDNGNAPTCKLPKMVLSAIQFEGSPGCIKKTAWYHPDVILGQCLEGIGDPTGRSVPVREHKREFGRRKMEWGRHSLDDYPPDIRNSSTGLFPLFSGRDIRTVLGSNDRLSNYVETPGQGVDAGWGTAFHLHNWFEGNDMATLRHKYLTYGHANPLASKAPLWMLDDDTDILVRCVNEIGNELDHKEVVQYLVPSNGTLGGNRPIYFLNTTYVEERHRLVKEMVRQDEEKYGPSYNAAGRIKFEG